MPVIITLNHILFLTSAELGSEAPDQTTSELHQAAPPGEAGGGGGGGEDEDGPDLQHVGGLRGREVGPLSEERRRLRGQPGEG